MDSHRLIYLEVPKVCPTCGQPTILNRSAEGIETVYCPNQDCPEKLIGKLAHFCERDCMDIQGMSEETIQKLVEAGFIKEYKDFFELDQKPGIAFLPGFGKQSWKKMCDAAEKARTTDFVHFVTAIGITNIGKGQAKMLYKYLSKNYDELWSWLCNGKVSERFEPFKLLHQLAVHDYPFAKIDGFGALTSIQIAEWFKENMPIDAADPIKEVYDKLIFTDEKPSGEKSLSILEGKSFCITGKLVSYKNRQALVDVIEANGGKWVDSVSSKTDYLINNDTESTSGKNKKAKELNIPIISEEAFNQLIGG